MRSMLFFEPMCSPTTSSVPPLLYVPTSVSSVPSEFSCPEGSHAEKKEREVLTRDKDPFGVNDDQSNFDFPVESLPTTSHPNPKEEGFRGGGGPEVVPAFFVEPARSVPTPTRHQIA